MSTPIYFYKAKNLSNLKADSIVAVKNDNESAFSLFITDKTGIPYPLKDLQNNVIITNTDGNLQITTSSTSTNINLATSILTTINSTLQSGDNISELVNDVGYLTTFTETDPIFQASEASLFVSGDKVNLDNQSNVNSGDQTSIVGISGTKAEFNTELTDGDFLFVGDVTQYTDELAQDAIGSIFIDSSTIDITYDDVTPSISANVKLNSIDATHLVDNINVSEFVNDEGYITDVNLGYTPSATNGLITNDKGSDATIPTVDFTNAGLLTPEEKQLLYNNSSTGVTKFDGFSINVDTTKYNTGIIEGWFVDNTTTPNTPTKVFKSFPATTANTLTNIATQNATYIAVDINGVHHQSGVPFEPEVQRDWIPLGVIVHSNRVSINAINNQPVVAINPNNQLSDLMESIGFFNTSGNVFTPNGVNLNINKSAGQVFKQGANFINDNKDPHTLALTSLIAPTNLRYRTQIGTEFANTAVIDAGFYDLAGVRTAIPGTKWSIQRIYLFQSNLVRIQYGQATYTTQAEAIQAITTEAFVVEQNILENGLFRALLIVREGATDLTDTSRALFIEASKFGSVAGLGSLSTTNLQQAYNNSLTPEIVTNSTLGAVSIKRGSTSDIDNVFEVQNGAGTVTSTIKGTGELTALTYNGYTPENLTNKQNSLTADGTGVKYPTVDAINAALPTTYSKIVYVNATSPTTATIFDLNNPPVTNDNLLKNDTSNLYIGNDASTWVYNGITYVTKVVPSSSNFYLSGTTTDAGNNKTASISRVGNVVIGANNASTSDKLNVIGTTRTSNLSVGTSLTTAGKSNRMNGSVLFDVNGNITDAITGVSSPSNFIFNSTSSTEGFRVAFSSGTTLAGSAYLGINTMGINLDGGGGGNFASISRTSGSLVFDGNHPTTGSLQFRTSGIEKARLFQSGNLLIQNGGAFTDDGVNKLQVPAGTISSGTTTLGNTQPTANNQLTRKDYVDTADALKANLASPALTGTPTAPTATVGTNTTQIATTAFVTTQISSKLNIASPIFTGDIFGQGNYVSEGELLLGSTNKGMSRYGSSTISFREISNIWTSSAPISATYFKSTVYTVATLPNPPITGTGTYATVSDATAPTYLGALTGGGSVVCPVFYNGTAWIPTIDSDSVSLTGNQTINGNKTFVNDVSINGVKVGKGGGNISSNTVLGNSAGAGNATGSNNLFLGQNAGLYNGGGFANTSSTNSIFIGNNTGNGIGEVNQIVIGDSVQGKGDNTTTIGNTSVVTTYLYGNVETNVGFKKTGGTASQFLKADGSVDGSDVVKNIAKEASQGANVTGTVSDVILYSKLIPANTFKDGDFMNLFSRVGKIGVAGTINHRVRINTANTLTGATFIAVNFATQTNLFMTIQRTFNVTGGNLIGLANSLNISNDITNNTAAPQSISFNPTIDNYIFITGQLSNSGDTMYHLGTKITN